MRVDPGRHRDRQRRGATGILVALGLLVAVGVTTAAVVTPLLDDAADGATDVATTASTTTTSASSSASAGGSPSAHGASQVSRSVARSVPAAQRVVAAKEIHRKPAKVIKREIALARQAEAEAEAAEAAALPVSLRIGSFNVLGSQHSTPTGDHSRFPAASWRTPQSAALIATHDVDVVGLQEVQADQLNGLLSATGFDAYPGYAFGDKETDNSILYDPNKFEFVEGSSFPITFEGHTRPQTVLKLRERTTGREMYFVNMHASAGGGPDAGTRAAGHNAVVPVLNQLRATGLPVFLTGDMNDRSAFFCRVLPPTGFVAAVGGDVNGGCHPPGRLQVDWVVGSPDVAFSGYWVDGSPQARKISDHFFVSATATIAPAG